MGEEVFTTENIEGFQELEKCRTALPACPIEEKELVTAPKNRNQKLCFMKKQFLQYELSVLTINAALATRDKQYPVYAVPSKQRDPFKKALRDMLAELSNNKNYINGVVSKKNHTALIKKKSEELSNDFPQLLHEKRFRVGVTQKVINLYLKYTWCAGFIKEPPHCPIDGIIRDRSGIKYNWTKSDSIIDYEKAIKDLNVIASQNGKSLSLWELEKFQRRKQ